MNFLFEDVPALEYLEVLHGFPRTKKLQKKAPPKLHHLRFGYELFDEDTVPIERRNEVYRNLFYYAKNITITHSPEGDINRTGEFFPLVDAPFAETLRLQFMLNREGPHGPHYLGAYEGHMAVLHSSLMHAPNIGTLVIDFGLEGANPEGIATWVSGELERKLSTSVDGSY